MPNVEYKLLAQIRITTIDKKNSQKIIGSDIFEFNNRAESILIEIDDLLINKIKIEFRYIYKVNFFRYYL